MSEFSKMAKTLSTALFNTTAITYEQIKISSPWEIQSLYDLIIHHTPNEHAKLHLRALLMESSVGKAGMEELADTQIKVYIDDAGQKDYLFIGRLAQADLRAQGGVYHITADFLSETLLLDRELKNRSFQNTKLTYADITGKILEDYPDKSCAQTAPKSPVNGPLIQYEETDWQFIKRLASYQETVIVPAIVHDSRIFTYGCPAGGKQNLSSDIHYTCGKDLPAYHEAKNYNPTVKEGEYAYFTVETYDKLGIGDKVTFLGYPLIVGQVTIGLKRGLLVYTAKLVREITLRQNPVYNGKLTGVSLAGRVLAAQEQAVKLHLIIDERQNVEEAYWYPFAPPTGDFLYLMPQRNTMASLYIPGLKEQDAVITGNLRTNGDTCAKTSDPNTRYLGTEHGQECKISPGGVYITAGHNELTVVLDDEQGVRLTSHRKLTLSAFDEIMIRSREKVFLRANSQVLCTTPATGFSLENDMHLSSPNLHINCTENSEFPSVKQPPPPKKQSPIINQKEADIDWNSIAITAIGAIAKTQNSSNDQPDMYQSVIGAMPAAETVLSPAGVPAKTSGAPPPEPQVVKLTLRNLTADATVVNSAQASIKEVQLQDEIQPEIEGKKPSEQLIDFLSQYEKFNATPNFASEAAKRHGSVTIGYGHMLQPGEFFQSISESQAKELLMKDLQVTVNKINALTAGLNLSQQQFDMLVSFAFNAGVGQSGLNDSGLLAAVRKSAGNEKIKAELESRIFSDGKSEELWRRRMDEYNMWTHGIYKKNEGRPVPSGFHQT
jgi:GH24 family phage-related lysozyme (muramidase)